MRNEELKALLDLRISPELSNTISALDKALIDAGFSMHQDEFNHLMGIESYVDSSTIVDDVVAILRVGASKVLAVMEVEISDDMPLDKLVELINYLITFGVSDDSQQIYDMIENREDNETLLCDIMEVVSEYNSGDYLPYITTVGKNLVEKMKEVIESGFVTEEIPSEDTSHIEQRLSVWEGDKPAIAQVLEEQNVPLGVDMEALYSTYSDTIADMAPKDAMDSLVYLALSSSVSNEALIDEIEFRMEDLFISLEDNQQGYNQLRKHKPSLESLVGEHDA